MRLRTSGRKRLAAGVVGTALLATAAWSVTVASADEESDAPQQAAGTEPIYDYDSAIQETVYIEAEMDSDQDGSPDLIAAKLMRPAETEGDLKVPVIVQPSPYFGLETLSAQDNGTMIPDDAAPDGHFSRWWDEYFVPRGYGYVELEMQGTAESEGCMSHGGEEDGLSVKALVDWLAGRTVAVDADGNEVTADWATPSIGMTGISYRGTLANQAATLGLPEIKTIVPTAAISSWYDYTNTHGLGYTRDANSENGSYAENYAVGLAQYAGNERSLELCDEMYAEMTEGNNEETWDYNDWWDERNYRDDADQITASVLNIHGQTDYNVKTNQVEPWWNALRAAGVDTKLWLHPDAHVDWTSSSPEAQEYIHRWFDYYLYGIDTGIADEPDVRVEHADGTIDTYSDWPDPAGADTTWHLGDNADGADGTLTQDAGAAGTHSVEPGDATDATFAYEDYLVADPTTAVPERSAYLSEPLTEAQHLSGAPELQVAFSSSTDSVSIAGFLVAYHEDGGYDVVSRGAMDGKNHSSLENGTPLTPGEQYTGTFDFEARDYTFQAGDRIGVVLAVHYANFYAVDPNAGALDVHAEGGELRMNLA